jgi:branched-chain amino acid transport system permease protein
MISGFFAGIAGGLGAINFEIVTAETVSGIRSGGYLLFTFLGGATFFFGPIIGAVMLVFAFVLLSELTKAWALYLGLAFVLMVMFAPGGVASLLMMNLRVAAFGKLRRLWTAYLALGTLGISLLLAFSAMVEMVFKLRESSGATTTLKFVAFRIDAAGTESWFGAGFVLIVSAFLFELARRHFVHDWGETQAEIEKEIKRREGL